MNGNLSEYSVRLHQIVFGGILLALSYLTVKHVMYAGSATGLKWAITGCVGVACLLLMDRHYWLLAPLAAFNTTTAHLGSLTEAFYAIFLGICFVRTALHLDKRQDFRPEVLIALPFFAWAAVCFFMNPSGLNILGSTSIGSRHYIKMFLGLFCMYELSRLQLTEKSLKILTYLSVSVTAMIFLFTIARAEDSTGKSTHYQYVMSSILLLWLFARFSLAEILGSLKLTLIGFLLFLTTLYNGGRMSTGLVLITPIIRMILTGKQRLLTFTLCIVSMILIVVIVLGHGTYYTLPVSAQRSLSFLPGKWAAQIQGTMGLKDDFRDVVHGFARDVIQRDPWMGRRGFAIDADELRWAVFTQRPGEFSGHEISGNWHSLWYGLAADFGIPALLFWFGFMIYMVFYTYRTVRLCRDGSYSQTVALNISFLIIARFIFSKDFGHSATTPFELCPLFGLLVAIRHAVLKSPS